MKFSVYLDSYNADKVNGRRLISVVEVTLGLQHFVLLTLCNIACLFFRLRSSIRPWRRAQRQFCSLGRAVLELLQPQLVGRVIKMF